jgi:propionyl-CoA carboxylase alpha chain/3-methylcrotonyl-CoA carboxylase alpha subunit/acetyl-CoA/propionyl-CoA carboxylase biotin carboxyl carrier protein
MIAHPMKDISKVLISNRGEIACRILRSLDRLDIPGVIVYHAVDCDSPAVKMAAEAMEIFGPTPVAAYLDVEQIIGACKQTGADAVHPGFGFLAEDPRFARRLMEEGITFIGPLPETIELMGNKVAARAFCLENGFPLAPSVTEAETGKEFAECAREIGFPMLIKAAAGGGGKGLHIVREIDDLARAIQLSKGEAKRSFGNDELYAERYVERPRHIEVQVLADHDGNVLHLGERDCSIQRRFQKIIEESPAPGLEPSLRERICALAVEITRKTDYRNAGTVEFILAPNDEFYFLEMNTRLQVEHPVTEMVTGLDLVELQIRIARGEAMSLTQNQVQTHGHAIELRLYAEDPENDFLPATGQLLAYRMPTSDAVRVENGFVEGMVVSSAFDPMLAKLIVHGKDRSTAIERGLKALRETLVLGVTTNVDYLTRILSHPAYEAGQIHTDFIPHYAADLYPPPLSEAKRNLLLAAAALSSREFTDPAFEVPEPYSFLGDWRN